jgi:hypothetical protein
MIGRRQLFIGIAIGGLAVGGLAIGALAVTVEPHGR